MECWTGSNHSEEFDQVILVYNAYSRPTYVRVKYEINFLYTTQAYIHRMRKALPSALVNSPLNKLRKRCYASLADMDNIDWSSICWWFCYATHWSLFCNFIMVSPCAYALKIWICHNSQHTNRNETIQDLPPDHKRCIILASYLVALGYEFLQRANLFIDPVSSLHYQSQTTL